MAKTIHLEIITPERTAFSDDVNIINVPSASGQIGILPGHVSLFTKLVEGEVKVGKGEENFYLAIGGGFLEVTKKKAVILVTSAYHAEELNETEILEAKNRAEQALSEKPQGEALVAAQAQYRRSVVALKVVKRRRKRLTDLP